MDSDNDMAESARARSQGIEDAIKPGPATMRVKRLAVVITLVSCILYTGLFVLISKYQALVAETIRELPLSIRIMLNIYQPFLVVFIIISVSLWILMRLSLNKPGGRYKLLLGLIVFNCLVAASLLGISVVRIN